MGLQWVLVVLGALGCLYWLAVATLVIQARRRIPRLAEATALAPSRWPRVSVVVPARNEIDTMAAAADALLRLDYPDLELVLVDDRSTDGTGELVDRLAESASSVSAVHIEELPDGWLGKVHAMHVGTTRATGDWLLFCDADAQLEPEVLSRVVAYAVENDIGCVTALPRLLEASLGVDALTTATARSVFFGARMWEAADPRSPRAAGFGAFMLIRRQDLERTDGLPWLRMEVADDFGLGLMLKSGGARCAVLNAVDSLRVLLYPTLAAARASLEKGSFAIIGGYSVARVIALCSAIVLVEVAPLATFIPGGPWWRPLVGVAWLLLGWGVTVGADRWLGRSARGGLLFPLGAILVVFFSLRSAFLGWRRGGVSWRETFYPLSALRSARRVRWP